MVSRLRTSDIIPVTQAPPSSDFAVVVPIIPSSSSFGQYNPLKPFDESFFEHTWDKILSEEADLETPHEIDLDRTPEEELESRLQADMLHEPEEEGLQDSQDDADQSPAREMDEGSDEEMSQASREERDQPPEVETDQESTEDVFQSPKEDMDHASEEEPDQSSEEEVTQVPEEDVGQQSEAADRHGDDSTSEEEGVQFSEEVVGQELLEELDQSIDEELDQALEEDTDQASDMETDSASQAGLDQAPETAQVSDKAQDQKLEELEESSPRNSVARHHTVSTEPATQDSEAEQPKATASSSSAAPHHRFVVAPYLEDASIFESVTLEKRHEVLKAISKMPFLLKHPLRSSEGLALTQYICDQARNAGLGEENVDSLLEYVRRVYFETHGIPVTVDNVFTFGDEIEDPVEAPAQRPKRKRRNSIFNPDEVDAHCEPKKRKKSAGRSSKATQESCKGAQPESTVPMIDLASGNEDEVQVDEPMADNAELAEPESKVNDTTKDELRPQEPLSNQPKLDEPENDESEADAPREDELQANEALVNEHQAEESLAESEAGDTDESLEDAKMKPRETSTNTPKRSADKLAHTAKNANFTESQATKILHNQPRTSSPHPNEADHTVEISSKKGKEANNKKRKSEKRDSKAKRQSDKARRTDTTNTKFETPKPRTSREINHTPEGAHRPNTISSRKSLTAKIDTPPIWSSHRQSVNQKFNSPATVSHTKSTPSVPTVSSKRKSIPAAQENSHPQAKPNRDNIISSRDLSIKRHFHSPATLTSHTKSIFSVPSVSSKRKSVSAAQENRLPQVEMMSSRKKAQVTTQASSGKSSLTIESIKTTSDDVPNSARRPSLQPPFEHGLPVKASQAESASGLELQKNQVPNSKNERKCSRKEEKARKREAKARGREEKALKRTQRAGGLEQTEDIADFVNTAGQEAIVPSKLHKSSTQSAKKKRRSTLDDPQQPVETVDNDSQEPILPSIPKQDLVRRAGAKGLRSMGDPRQPKDAVDAISHEPDRASAPNKSLMHEGNKRGVNMRSLERPGDGGDVVVPEPFLPSTPKQNSTRSANVARRLISPSTPQQTVTESPKRHSPFPPLPKDPTKWDLDF